MRQHSRSPEPQPLEPFLFFLFFRRTRRVTFGAEGGVFRGVFHGFFLAWREDPPAARPRRAEPARREEEAGGANPAPHAGAGGKRRGAGAAASRPLPASWPVALRPPSPRRAGPRGRRWERERGRPGRPGGGCRLRLRSAPRAPRLEGGGCSRAGAEAARLGLGSALRSGGVAFPRLARLQLALGVPSPSLLPSEPAPAATRLWKPRAGGCDEAGPPRHPGLLSSERRVRAAGKSCARWSRPAAAARPPLLLARASQAFLETSVCLVHPCDPRPRR